MDIWLIMIIVAATIGGVIASLLGWKKQNPRVPFDWVEFAVSVGSSLIAGCIYAVSGITKSDNPTKDFIIAMVFGPGGGDILRGAAGALNQARKGPVLPPKLPPSQPA